MISIFEDDDYFFVYFKIEQKFHNFNLQERKKEMGIDSNPLVLKMMKKKNQKETDTKDTNSSSQTKNNNHEKETVTAVAVESKNQQKQTKEQQSRQPKSKNANKNQTQSSIETKEVPKTTTTTTSIQSNETQQQSKKKINPAKVQKQTNIEKSDNNVDVVLPDLDSMFASVKSKKNPTTSSTKTNTTQSSNKQTQTPKQTNTTSATSSGVVAESNNIKTTGKRAYSEISKAQATSVLTDDQFDPRATKKGRRYTQDGLAIYTEDELNINKADAGNTELCPFDCDCCF